MHNNDKSICCNVVKLFAFDHKQIVLIVCPHVGGVHRFNGPVRLCE